MILPKRYTNSDAPGLFSIRSQINALHNNTSACIVYAIQFTRRLFFCLFFPFVYTLLDFVDFNEIEAKLIGFRTLVNKLTLLLHFCTRRALSPVGMPIIF